MTGFLKLNRGPEADFLDADMPANHLLMIIAKRARRTDCERTKLKAGQCFLGDFKAYGMSRQQYRGALKRLFSNQYITIEATNKGSIVTLINSTVYDINVTVQQPAEQPAPNQLATTNKNVRMKEVSVVSQIGQAEFDEYAEYCDQKIQPELITQDQQTLSAVPIPEQTKKPARKKSNNKPITKEVKEQIRALYQEHCPDLLGFVSWSPIRERYFKKLWNSDVEHQDIFWWQQYFDWCNSLPLLSGQVNDWKANFEFIVNPNNYPKIIEGTYNNNYQDKRNG